MLTRTDYVTVSSGGGGYTTTTTVITHTYDRLNPVAATLRGTNGREAMTTTAETVTYTYEREASPKPAEGMRRTLSARCERPLISVGGVSYTWDDNGNLTNDGVYTYTWNAAGRMVGAESITHTMVYTYNSDGVRVAQSVDGQVTTWVQNTCSRSSTSEWLQRRSSESRRIVSRRYALMAGRLWVYPPFSCRVVGL